MLKKNLFIKKINKSVLSITNRIESFFNFFKENISYKKKFSKTLKTVDKRIFFIAATIVITITSYFLIPSFYDKDKIKAELENQIYDQYNLKVKFDQSLKYGLFPKPHFYSKSTIISYKSIDVAKSKNIKIFISIKNFFLSDSLEIKDLVFKKTDFKINSLSFNFFTSLLGTNKSNQEINFLSNKFFYLDKNDEVIFFANLKKLNYLYEDDFLKKLSSKLDIFNIPISLEVEHNIIEKKFFIKVNSHPLRLNIKNNSNYDDEKLDGKLDLTIINKERKINYSLKDSSLDFNTNDNEFTGNINIKPFFLSLYSKLNQIDLKKIFKDNSILVNILKSEVLNNKNFNGKININTNEFKGVNFLNEIKSTILLEEGDIIVQNLRTNFKDSVIINLNNTQLIVDNNKLKFAGNVILDFADVDNFYSHYQINRKDRKRIKKINFGFLFNLDDEFIEIDNLKVDGNSNRNLEKFLSNLNSKKENIFNKVILRNSIQGFFRNF